MAALPTPRAPRSSFRVTLVARLAGAVGCMPIPLILASRGLIAGALRLTPGLRRRVTRNMVAALGEEPVPAATVQAYFRNLADQMAYTAAIYRSGEEGLGALKREWGRDPRFTERYRAGIATVQEHLRGGRGVVLVGPHMTGHEVLIGLLAEELPVTVFVRRSSDARYEAIKQRWYAALGVETVYRPLRSARQPALEEMMSAMRCLRKNHVLALTPDILQKKGKGIPVRLLGRRAELPAGPFFLAGRTGAPLLPVFDYSTRERFDPRILEPLQAPAGSDREAAVADLAQQWATLFEAYLRERPDRWQFWLDRAWTRWLEQ